MKFKPREMHVSSLKEFEEMIYSADIRISEAIIEGILSNLDTKKVEVLVLSVICKDDGDMLNIIAETKNFIPTLEENMQHYLREERYEDCQRISEVIKKLKEQ